MSTLDAITTAQLSRLIGTADAPLVIDVCTDEDTPLIPAHCRRAFGATIERLQLGQGLCRPSAHTAQKLSQGVAAWLRHAGAQAEDLEGGPHLF